MATPSRSHLPYLIFTTVLWGAALPGVLVADAGGGIPWRSSLLVTGGVFLAIFGAVLIMLGSRNLATVGVGLFGVRPGSVLVVDGIHGRLRNPVDAGSVLVALAGWAALDLELGWVVPAAALVSFVAGVGPYEDRLLLERFGDEFRNYRRRVSKWLPLRRRPQ